MEASEEDARNFPRVTDDFQGKRKKDSESVSGSVMSDCDPMYVAHQATVHRVAKESDRTEQLNSSKHMQLCNQSTNRNKGNPEKKKNTSMSICSLQLSPTTGYTLLPSGCGFFGALDSKRYQVYQN